MHGVILCSGQGSRFAHALHANTPYPKHLELINGLSLLHRATKTIGSISKLERITFSVNPDLILEYLRSIRDLQQYFPKIDFSINAEDASGEGTSSNITAQKILREGITRINEQHQSVSKEDVSIFMPGDQFFTPDTQIKKVREFVQETVNRIRPNESSLLGNFASQHGFLFEIGTFRAVADNNYRQVLAEDIHIFNINTPEDLYRAEQTVIEFEGDHRNNPEGLRRV